MTPVIIQVLAVTALLAGSAVPAQAVSAQSEVQCVGFPLLLVCGAR